jgi:hypothetical protein
MKKEGTKREEKMESKKERDKEAKAGDKFEIAREKLPKTKAKAKK